MDRKSRVYVDIILILCMTLVNARLHLPIRQSGSDHLELSCLSFNSGIIFLYYCRKAGSHICGVADQQRSLSLILRKGQAVLVLSLLFVVAKNAFLAKHRPIDHLKWLARVIQGSTKPCSLKDEYFRHRIPSERTPHKTTATHLPATRVSTPTKRPTINDLSATVCVSMECCSSSDNRLYQGHAAQPAATKDIQICILNFLYQFSSGFKNAMR